MPWIEGIGDEVTIGVSIALGVCILFFAWLSTGIRDIPFISVIVVQLTRRRVVHSENAETPSSAEGNSPVNEQESETGDRHDAREATPSGSETLIEASNLSSQENSLADGETTVESSHTASEELKVVDKSSASCQNLVQTKDVSTSGKYNPESEQESSNSNNTANTPEAEQDICPPSNTELRQRRLEFFTSQSSGTVPCDDKTVCLSEISSRDSENNDRINNDNETRPACAPEPKPLSKLASDLLSSSQQTGTETVNASTGSYEQNEQTQSERESGSQESGLEPGEIRVRIKFLNDTQRLVTALATETIGNFRRRHFSTELSQSKLVRFIFNGKDLRNDASTLQSYNICDNSVLHCLVTQQQQQQQPDHHGDEEGLDIGMFMFPLFGLLLGIVWYMRFMYRQFFNVTSTLTLGGITFLYLAALISSLRGHRNHEHID